MAGKLSMASLTRAWTLLLKGLQETLAAPSPLRAAEMALIRLCYAADLPSPSDALKALQNGGGAGGGAVRRCRAPRARRRWRRRGGPSRRPQPASAMAQPAAAGAGAAAQSQELHRGRGPVRGPARGAAGHSPDASCARGALRARPDRVPARADRRRPTSRRGSSELLGQWTGRRWIASVSSAEGKPTLTQQKAANADTLRSQAEADPLVQAILKTFPGAKLDAVRRKGEQTSLVAGLAGAGRGAAAGRGIPRRRRHPGKRVLMFDKLKDLGGLMQQAQADAAEDAGAAGQLERLEIVGSSGAGLVKVTVNGKNETRKVEIDASLFVPDDKGVVEDLIVAAANDARTKVEETVQEQMQASPAACRCRRASSCDRLGARQPQSDAKRHGPQP